MFDQFPPGPTRPAHRLAKVEDFASTVAAALFFGAGLLITSALHEAELQAPSCLSSEALPPACELIVGSPVLELVPPQIAQLCANYY